MNLKRKVYNSLRKKRTKTHVDSPHRANVEKTLLKFGVNREAYHGGDLTGGNVERFLQQSSDFFPEIEGKFKAIPRNERAYTDEEISDVCARFVELATLMDGMFALARTTTGEATEAVLSKTTRYVEAVSVKWRDLGLTGTIPKLHVIQKHLVSQMQKV